MWGSRDALQEEATFITGFVQLCESCWEFQNAIFDYCLPRQFVEIGFDGVVKSI